MRSAYMLFGAGALVGAIVMYFAHSRGGDPAAAAIAGEPAAAAEAVGAEPALRSIDFLTLAAGSVSVAEHAALFRLAAAADRSTVEALAAQVAGLPNIEGRSLALEALFTRYAELDAAAAADFARTLELPAAALTPLYTSWARRDARSALAALGELPAQDALTLGVELLAVLGNDGLGIARVLGAAPHVDADRFRIEAAAAKAATDPAGALDDALLLPPTRARAALERIAVAWAARDVYEALGAVQQIAEEDLRAGFKNAILRAWSRTDPDALVDYVLDLEPEAREEALRSGAMDAFALIDPNRALQAAETMSSGAAMLIRRSALMSLARDDPQSAVQLVAALPPGNDRDQMLSIVAASYGRADPEGALAWAQSMSPPAPGVWRNVLAGLARVDPSRAIELAFEANAADRQSALMAIVTNGGLDAAHTAQLADRLLAMPGRNSGLETLTQTWARRAPRDALQWLLAKGDAAPSGAIAQAGVALARADPAAAIGFLAAIPTELRSAWIGSIAEGYGRNDPRAAAAWVTQHRGDAGYEAAVAAIAGHTAARDPAAGARLLDSIDLGQLTDAPARARLVAASWARQDPLAAASWARSLPHADAATAAIGIVATQWVVRDPGAARSWTLGLPAGAARDAALVQIVGATAGTAPDALTLLDAFSSASALERGVNDAVRMIAQRDPATARELADRYLTDPAMRQAAERFIEQGARGPPPFLR